MNATRWVIFRISESDQEAVDRATCYHFMFLKSLQSALDARKWIGGEFIFTLSEFKVFEQCYRLFDMPLHPRFAYLHISLHIFTSLRSRLYCILNPADCHRTCFHHDLLQFVALSSCLNALRPCGSLYDPQWIPHKSSWESQRHDRAMIAPLISATPHAY